MAANKTVVGLDIGTSNLRAVQTSFKGQAPIIEKVAWLPLRPDIIVDGEIQEPEQLTQAIKALWKTAGFTTDEVRLGIGGDRVISRLAELDWANDKDLTKILPFSAEEVLPIEVSDYTLDYHTLSEYTRKEADPDDDEETIFKRKKYVLIAGAQTHLVKQHVDAVLEAKLRPISVDIQSLAMLRAYDRPQAPDDLADITIDIGGDNLTIIVHKLGQPLYIRTISDVGGRVITSQIQKEFNITFRKAEQRKFQALYGSSISEQESTRTVFDMEEDDNDIIGVEEDSILEDYNAKERVRRSREIVSPMMGGIILSIRETIDGFAGSGLYTDINSFAPLVLSGGVSGTPHLVDRLTSELGIEAGLASPISGREHKHIPEDIMEREHEFATAVGLAIGNGASHE